jgi:hypothetical protein
MLLGGVLMTVHVWKAGWHIACDRCSEDSSNASTIGHATKASAEAAAKEHAAKCTGAP